MKATLKMAGLLVAGLALVGQAHAASTPRACRSKVPNMTSPSATWEAAKAPRRCAPPATKCTNP